MRARMLPWTVRQEEKGLLNSKNIPRNYTAVGSDGNELDLYPAHPAHGREVVLKQEVVSLVVKAPLADDQVSSAVLAFLHHVHKVFLFLLGELISFARARVCVCVCFRVAYLDVFEKIITKVGL